MAISQYTTSETGENAGVVRDHSLCCRMQQTQRKDHQSAEWSGHSGTISIYAQVLLKRVRFNWKVYGPHIQRKTRIGSAGYISL